MKTLKYYFHTLFAPSKDPYPSTIRTKNIMDSFNFLVQAFKTHERLFFVRFGDGEFVTLMQQDHRNYVFNENLEKELAASFRIEHQEYLIACPINYPYDEFHAKGIYRQFSWQQQMIDVMQQRNFPQNLVFENPCIFQCLAVFKPKVLKDFLDNFIRKERKMFIGSTDKVTAEKLYGPIEYYVQIPERNAYETIGEWWPEVEQNVEKVDLVIPSAGSTSNAIAVRLWNKGVRCKVIDFGSVVDAVAQKTSRSWIRLQGHKVLKTLENPPELPLAKRWEFLRKDIKFYFRNQII
ncbi:hypothetical protein LCGC14_2431140 [marine sediment metagenome]|uniref:Glycosyltransferase GT-D fold domain-containing protein n=2 Tax=root TaxID=1 RepID=A0A831QQ24_9FLAO|nr:hypothetical protein [Pricia antarctica]